MHRLRPV
jgi:hypothetical protein